MKNINILSLFLIASFFAVASFTSCSDSDIIDDIDDTITITIEEQNDLLFMREEEKLARDVYLHFFEKYDINIFNNIAASEQKHMDAVLEMMIKYNVEDVASEEYGVFENVELQELYDVLIEQGDASLVAALIVGATIEDVDIRDLDNAIAGSSHSDIINMYNMLNCGSRNHMRGFSGKLNEQGETYTPQFITQEKYDEVLDGSHENCG